MSRAVVERLGLPRDGFGALTFPRLASLLVNPRPGTAATGAFIDGQPAGLALGHIEGEGAALLSLAVARPYRGRGLGGALLRDFEEAAALAGARIAEVNYPGHLPARIGLERLLAREGWAPPRLHLVQLVGFAGGMAERGGTWPGVARLLAVPGHFSFDPWAPVSGGDETVLDALLAESGPIAPPDPRRSDATFDPHCSLALRRDGRLVGWVIGEPVEHAMGPGTISDGTPSVYYATAYCAQQYQRSGILVAGYHSAFSRQAATLGPLSRAIYRTHPGAHAMLTLSRRRFAAEALRFDEVWSAKRHLGMAGSASQMADIASHA